VRLNMGSGPREILPRATVCGPIRIKFKRQVAKKALFLMDASAMRLVAPSRRCKGRREWDNRATGNYLVNDELVAAVIIMSSCCLY
jgi:hypothetical protein